VGSGGTETSAFYTYPSSLSPYAITNENAITVGTVAGNLTYGNSTYGGDQAGPISNAFPKGYNAFYCMKYEITQGEYTDFLNKLPSSTLAATRYPGNKGSYRQTIGGTWPNYTNAAPDRAANWLNWADGAAYGDWAGLRPMTELEFEKACRGPAVPVPNEYAWGNTTLVAQTNEAGVAGSGMETALPANARCNENKNLISSTDYGPTRVGIYATTNSSRIQSGASYWGIMELSGNVNERVVSAGSTTGRAFTGVHGDGVLYDGTNTVDAKVYNWPGTNAVGSGLRGGSCTASDAQELFSDRFYGAYENAARYQGYGWRGVRTAPQ
jgi:formylglycine-generating enzyme required for sulfatase activity